MPETGDNLFFFYGSDQALLEKQVRLWSDDFCKEKSIGLDILDAQEKSLEEIIYYIRTPSLFDDTRLIWIKNPNFFQRAISSKELTIFETIISDPKLHDVIAISSVNPDQRLKSFQILKKKAAIKEISIHPDWFQKQAQMILDPLGVQIDGNALEKLVIRCAQNAALFESEILKLALFVSKGTKRINLNVLEDVSSSYEEAPFFKIGDDLFSSEPMHAIRTIQMLAKQGENDMGILLYLINLIRLMIQVKEHTQKLKPGEIPERYHQQRVSQLLSEIPECEVADLPKNINIKKQHPYRVFSILKQSQKYSLEQLLKIYLRLGRLYMDITNSKNPKIYFEEFALAVSQISAI